MSKQLFKQKYVLGKMYKGGFEPQMTAYEAYLILGINSKATDE